MKNQLNCIAGKVTQPWIHTHVLLDTPTHLLHSSSGKWMGRWSWGWRHDIMKLQSNIVQPSIAFDFPHTARHVTGGEVERHPVFFSITGGEEGGRGGGGSASTANSWAVWPDATWEESGRGDSYSLILPNLPALTVTVLLLLLLFLHIWFVLFHCLFLLPFAVSSSRFTHFHCVPSHALLSLVHSNIIFIYF